MKQTVSDTVYQLGDFAIGNSAMTTDDGDLVATPLPDVAIHKMVDEIVLIRKLGPDERGHLSFYLLHWNTRHLDPAAMEPRLIRHTQRRCIIVLGEIFVAWCCTIALRVLSLHKDRGGNSPLRMGNFALSLLAAWFLFAAYVTAGWSTCALATSRAGARRNKLPGAAGFQLSPSAPLRAGLRSG